MKAVLEEKRMLHILKDANCNLFKAIIKNCNDCVIQALSEILHNVLLGNVNIDKKVLKKLKPYKTKLQKTHKKIKNNKSVKYRRRLFSNQTGGFWPILLNTVLPLISSIALEKLKKNGERAKQ